MTKSIPTKNRTLKELKSVVDKNLNSTIECGMALREIRDRKLYLEECGTFEEFCRDNWGVSKGRAYQLIDSADVVESLPPEKSTMVDSERTARELKKVPAEKRPEVLDKAKASGKVTGKSVSTAAKSMKEEVPDVLDKTDFPIPPDSPAMTTWMKSDEIQVMLTGISRIKGILTRANEQKDPMFCEINFSAILADISSVYQLMKVAIPFCVCPTCQGRVLSPCTTCGGRGMVSEFYWKHKVPEEIKKIRAKAIVMKKGKK